MDIEDLSKSQLLLLTLLVNFVMSIATGIVTVSLLDEAPPVITQTVNRIVEHTVETVVPESIQPVSPAPSNTPSEEDRLVSAVSAANNRTVFLYRDATTSPALARGIYLPITRAAVFVNVGNLPDEAVVEFPNGAVEPASRTRDGQGLVLYGFSDGAKLPTAPAANLVPPGNLKQGQAVIAIRADGSAVTGIVSKVDPSAVTTTLPDVPPGTAAVDLSGRVIGINGNGTNTYLVSDLISDLISATN